MNRGAAARLATCTALGALCLGLAGASAAQSPTYIAYVRGSATSQPAVWEANGTGGDAHRFAPGSEAAVSPDGRYVAVTAISAKVGVEIYSQAGSSRFRWGNANSSVMQSAWSANSRYLAFSVEGPTAGAKGSGLLVVDTGTDKATWVAHGVIEGFSFNPAGTELAYADTASQNLKDPVNLYSVGVDGGKPTQLTSDGRSLDPLWVRSGIVFDQQTLRGETKAPAYQLWLRAGSTERQLTHMRIPPLLDGLVGLQASADGNHILASYSGEDTYDAWAVQLSPFRATEVKVNGQPVQPAAISSNGQELLVSSGGFEQPADNGTVEIVGFSGGAGTKLARGVALSWNR